MRKIQPIIFLLMIAAIVFSIAGCSAVGVKVWERDILSRPEMRLDDDGINQDIDDHIYFSKESSSGGRGLGGGGCGCN